MFDVRQLPQMTTRQSGIRIALVLLLHVALLWLAMRPVHRLAERDDRIWIQLLNARPQPTTEPVGKPALTVTGRARQVPVPPPRATETPAPESPEERVLVDDATLTPKADITQQALKTVGAIDRELRAEHRQEIPIRSDSPSARLSRGMEAAHAAVKPKWFEPARTELISAPNDPKRIYKVTTAMGEHCLYYPDKGSISANSDPRSGRASFGQPTVSSCPIPF